MINIPRVLIAGTHSGVGKTTVATGLIAALAKRGLVIQPFKAGPDYIDPSYHSRAAGRPSRNLDTWLLNENLVRGIFQRACADAPLAIVEGVMGVFDGHASTNDRGSTAELAKILELPVILVVDGSHLARSVAAIVKGYVDFDPRVRVAGVIVNRVSERHFLLLRAALRRYTSTPALGYLPFDSDCSIPERHLGLVPAREDARVSRVVDRLGEAVSKSIDLDRVVRIANAARPLGHVRLPWHTASQRRATTIGVARDQAFHFYYQENLELLQACGATLVEFSPLADARLPHGLDALYLGGGFPELFAEPLSRNRPLRQALHHAISQGLPTYAECGGLMYLAKRLCDGRGRSHAMVGILPGSIRMTKTLQSFGYVTVVPRRDTILARAGDRIKGHEFHYSVWDHHVPSSHAAYTVFKRPKATRQEGFARANVLASYIHVHFLTNSRWARGLVASAQRWRDAKQRSSVAV